ncbi:cobalamin-dependent protein [bacterium]|nr:cobalamin-dependent protein [candidate division CSSED10-310 bacterium]
MKVLLIVPPGGYYAERWSGGVLMAPLGIGYVAACLEVSECDVEILDAHVNHLNDNDIARFVEQGKPDIVGLTFTTENRFEAFATARAIKSAAPFVHLTAGGPHVSLAAEDTLEGVDAIDSVVVGEGEKTFCELVSAFSVGGLKALHKVHGIVFRNEKGDIFRTEKRAQIENLDEIPFPARHLYPSPDHYNFSFDVPGKGKRRFANLMTSRGCPCACNFCATPKVWGRKVRMRSPENIISEIDMLVENQHAEALWFFDDTFNTSPKRVEEICRRMKERRFELPWFCEVRVDVMTKPLLAAMRDAGCYTIGFGVESGSQRILDDVIGKHLKLEQVHALYEWCKELDVIANPFFIISHPTETWEEAQQTLDLIKQFKEKSHVSMAFLHVYPGTALEVTARENGTLPDGFKWHHEHRNDVKTLASAQGNVPIFMDRLSWAQISDLLFEWATMQKYSVWRKIPRVVKSIRSWEDFKRYSTMGLRFLRRLILH